VLKYDARTGYQKGFAFAVYSSEEDVERVLDGGQDVV
jgi:RNA recognition motif-containing protein